MPEHGHLPTDCGSQRQPKSLRLRVRQDLEFYPHRGRGGKVWVVKDPLALKYFRFREEECAILRWLDGKVTLTEMSRRFESAFAPQRMSETRLHAFVAQLHRCGLVISESPGQGATLLERHQSDATQRRNASLLNPLAIRFRGFDPQRLLDLVYPRIRWAYSKWFLCVCGMLVVAALGLLVGQREGVFKRLPEWNALLGPNNLIWLAVALGMTKLIHELGHAFTCRHFGADCHEMGVMLLVLTPCLYCNVTDAWKLEGRWQRIAISSAGILVEVVLASCCVILWWLSQPGFFNTLCLNVVVVCSVGTLLLNGNPLLRYDGYYILSDWCERPNLWQDSRARMNRWWARLFWGVDPGNPVSLQNRSAFSVFYGLLSVAYRTFVMFSVLYVVYRVLEPLGLVLVARFITLTVVVGMLMIPLNSMRRTMSSPALRRRIRPWRASASILFLVALFVGALTLPLPCRVRAPAMVEPLDARRVYVPVGGQLVSTAREGDLVESGQPLALLQNFELRQEFERMHGQAKRQRARLAGLESMRGRDENVAAQIPAAKEILADFEEQARQLKHDLDRLQLVSPVDGTVLAPPPIESPVAPDGNDLRGWVGTPLQSKNLGCTLQRQTLYCLVGRPDQFAAVLYVHQSEVESVRIGQRVKLQFDVSPGKVLTGIVSEVARNNLETVPAELAVDQALAGRKDASSGVRPEETSYQVRVNIDGDALSLVAGSRGHAKVFVDSQPLARRIARFFARTFKPVM